MEAERKNDYPELLVVVRAEFSLGVIVVTRGAMEQLRPSDIEAALNRHARREWGEMCEEDRRTNDRSLETLGGVTSVHTGGESRARFYVITDPGHAVTTVLLPSEY